MEETKRDINAAFDFEAHRRHAIDLYLQVKDEYDKFAKIIRNILQDAVERKKLKIHSIEARSKTIESFGTKVTTPSDEDPNSPKYSQPLAEIEDLAGVRVITFFPRTVAEVGECIAEEFNIVSTIDHTASRLEEETFGYRSVHYVVALSSPRTRLPEYQRFSKLRAEIQVRTVMQHAWAEIEHDIQYKSSVTIPPTIRRRFMALAGLLEISDREFQAIQDADQELRQAARASVNEGRLEGLTITPDALKAYLDRKFGEDLRMSEFTYEWTTRLLLSLGFTDFSQVDRCIGAYDDDRISRVLYGSRRGQVSRFEDVLLAGMGQAFIDSHIWKDEGWFRSSATEHLSKLRAAKIPIGSYSPKNTEGPEKSASAAPAIS